MDGFSFSEQDAFRFIQTTAMRERSTMGGVAQRIIDGELVPGSDASEV